MAENSYKIPSLDEIKDKWNGIVNDIADRLKAPTSQNTTVASNKNKILTKEEKKDYAKLVEAAKKRYNEDESLAMKFGFGIVGGDYMDYDYKYKNIYIKPEKMSEGEHFLLLKKEEGRLLNQPLAERKKEDTELAAQVAEKIGGNVGDVFFIEGLGKFTARQLAEKVMEQSYKHEDTSERAMVQVNKIFEKITANLPDTQEKANEALFNLPKKVHDIMCNSDYLKFTGLVTQCGDLPSPPAGILQQKGAPNR